jgi:hypothetical protein
MYFVDLELQFDLEDVVNRNKQDHVEHKYKYIEKDKKM